MTRYPTLSHYLDTELNSPSPILLMSSIRLESDKYQFDKSLVWRDLEPNSRSPAHETCALLIQPSVEYVCLLLFYAIVRVFQLYHGSDMMYMMRRRKPKPTFVPTQRSFNFAHHIIMVWAELVFDDAISYIQWGKWIPAQLNAIAMTKIHTPVLRVIYPAL